MIGREACLRILKNIIKDSPSEQTEAILQTEDSSLTRFTGSTIHQHVAERNSTLILRLVVGKRISVVTTNILSKSSLKKLLEKALSLVKVQPPNEEFVSLPGPKPIPKIETYFKKIENLTPEKKVKTIKDIFKIGRDNGLNTSGAFSNGVVELSVVNSLGVEAYQRYSDLFIHIIFEDEKSSGYSSFVSRDPDKLDIESLALEAAKKVKRREAIEIDPGEYEVILEPYAVSELLSFLSYLGFHALAVQEGRSFFCNEFGKKMVDEKVTI
jgi:predicted Zn-dependent protease